MTTRGAIQRQQDDIPAGTRIGRYRVEEPVGRGGMGTVYRSFDETTNRNVALKLLAPGIPDALRTRFLAECEAEANIRHGHVMPVYDRGWLTEERPYFVMELLYQPITLTELVEEIGKGTLGATYPRLRAWNDLRRLVEDVVLPVCEGVAVANLEYGVQHRDLKPDNVLIDIRTRRAYLIDFGICRPMDDHQDEGKIVGTPRYLSPEQAAGRVDARTDVWGLGAILQHVVTGEPPLAGTSPFRRAEVQERIAALRKAEEEAAHHGHPAKARGYAKRREQLEDPTLRVQEDLLRDARDGIYLPLPEGLNPGLTAIVRKALAPRSEDRYADAGALAADLRAWVHGGRVKALTERGARRAAVDWARRLLNRHVVRAAGTVFALGFGWLLGTGLFARVPPPPDHRLEDATADLRTLAAAWDAFASGEDAGTLPARGSAALGWCLRSRTRRVLARARGLQAAHPGDEALAHLRAQVAARLKPARLTLDGWRDASQTQVEDLAWLTGNAGVLRGDQVSLFPGPYRLACSASAGLHLSVLVPRTPGHGFRVGSDGVLEGHLAVTPPPGDVPGDMTIVPAGPAVPGGDAILPAFFARRGLVTNERYSEWLDDLSPVERQARVPPTGFERSSSDPQRWLAVRESATRPVLGVRPQDARAYAAWRSRVDGVTLRLPSAAQWQRMAAVDRAADPGSEDLFPWRSATWARALRRRGGALAGVPPDADVSPYGVRGLFARAGEIVRVPQGGGFGLKARGGIVPTTDAILRTEPLAADAAGEPYGFRLVLAP